MLLIVWLDGGYVFIKEMNNRNILYKYFSRFHDLIMAGDIINEISVDEVKDILVKL